MTQTIGTGAIEDRARDLELARRMTAQDHAALAEVYDEHRNVIFTAVHRLLGDAAAADVTHDAFLLAFERATSFRGDAPLGAWIRRIAINLALRSMRRERWLDRLRARWMPAPLAGPAPAEAIDLDRAIAHLPETLRAPFILHAIEGYSHAEASSVLGISEAACRQRLHRARARLASVLSDEDPQ